MAKASETDDTKLTTTTPQTNYVIEPKGFWHNLDKRIEKWLNQPPGPFGRFLKSIGSGIKSIWGSKIMSPVRWVTSKIANFANDVLQNPAVQFTLFTVSLAFAIGSLILAAPAAMPIAAAALGIVVGGKIAKTAYEARKSYRKEELEKQLDLLKTLQAMRDVRNDLLSNLPKDISASIEPHLTKKTHGSTVHKRSQISGSKEFVKNLLVNLPSIASAAINVSGIPHSLHSISEIAKAASLARAGQTTISQPISSRQESYSIVTTENEIRTQINELSDEMQVPHCRSNDELLKFVGETAADMIALNEIIKKRKEPVGASPEQEDLDLFQELREDAKKAKKHTSPIEERGSSFKKALTHIGRAFLGLKSSSTPSIKGETINTMTRRDDKHHDDDTHRIG